MTNLDVKTTTFDEPILLLNSKDSNKKCSLIKSRTILWYFVLLGFIVNYMMRINLNITIVDMIYRNNSLQKDNNKDGAIEGRKFAENECQQANLRTNVTEDLKSNLSLKHLEETRQRFSMEREFFHLFNIEYNRNGFDWNEHQQGLLLGSFYWLHWALQIPGGILSRKYGTKLVFGFANFIGCLLCVLMPIAAFLDYKFLIGLRVLQGFISGLAWPSMQNLTAQWIPPNERSKFVSAYLGSSLGIAIFFPLFGFVIARTSWEWVFHMCAVIGSLWFIGWQFFVFDSPSEHPRIDPSEQDYIETSLGETIEKEKNIPIPWKEILTSKVIWIIILAQWGGIWSLFTLLTQAPTYFKLIHGWNIQMSGFLSGLPHLLRMLFALGFSIFSDFLLQKNLMTRTNVRKMAGTFCYLINGICIIALAYSGCNSLNAIIFLTLALMVHGAVSTGPLSNIVDISPNYSGIVQGIIGMIGVLPGFISPIVVGFLTLNNQTANQWKIVFLISAGMLLCFGSVYVLFTDSQVQPWNNYKYFKNNNKLVSLDTKSSAVNIKDSIKERQFTYVESSKL